MKKYIKIEFESKWTSECESKNEVIESCGFNSDEITFEELLEKIKGEIEVIEIESDSQIKVNFLNDVDDDDDDD